MLETQSTDSGQKSFIAVGTTINRGEDLAVKGAVCHRLFFYSMPTSEAMFSRTLDLHLRDRRGRT